MTLKVNYGYFSTVAGIAGNGRRVWEVAPIEPDTSKKLLIIKFKNYV